MHRSVGILLGAAKSDADDGVDQRCKPSRLPLGLHDQRHGHFVGGKPRKVFVQDGF